MSLAGLPRGKERACFCGFEEGAGDLDSASEEGVGSPAPQESRDSHILLEDRTVWSEGRESWGPASLSVGEDGAGVPAGGRCRGIPRL